jgi:hypothetical protein
VFTARQVNDLGTDLCCDLFQFCPTDAGPVDLEICTFNGNNGKTRTARAFAYVTAVTYKDLAHRNPLLKDVWSVLNLGQIRVLLDSDYRLYLNRKGLSTIMLYIGVDDTDNAESRGTGHLARQIAAALAADFHVLGVTRHQLLVDPRVPCTKNNSSAAITLSSNGEVDTTELSRRVRRLMLSDFQPDSDPGLCVAQSVPAAVIQFGHRAQHQLVTQEEARSLAAAHGLSLEGLGGNEDGVIGALAAVGLATSGEDGRYVLVGRSRELSGLQPVSALLAAGITAVQTPEGHLVTRGLVQTDKLRPARRGGQPVAVVEWRGDHWHPLRLD